MTVNVVRERAPRRDPRARAYYERLERESTLLREFSPYDDGAEPVPFDFDLSYNYYPPAYERPGPTVRIYRLRRLRAGLRAAADPDPEGAGARAVRARRPGSRASGARAPGCQPKAPRARSE